MYFHIDYNCFVNQLYHKRVTCKKKHGDFNFALWSREIDFSRYRARISSILPGLVSPGQFKKHLLEEQHLWQALGDHAHILCCINLWIISYAIVSGLFLYCSVLSISHNSIISLKFCRQIKQITLLLRMDVMDVN